MHILGPEDVLPDHVCTIAMAGSVLRWRYEQGAPLVDETADWPARHVDGRPIMLVVRQRVTEEWNKWLPAHLAGDVNWKLLVLTVRFCRCHSPTPPIIIMDCTSTASTRAAWTAPLPKCLRAAHSPTSSMPSRSAWQGTLVYAIPPEVVRRARWGSLRLPVEAMAPRAAWLVGEVPQRDGWPGAAPRHIRPALGLRAALGSKRG
jgi:hypothetical protein